MKRLAALAALAAAMSSNAGAAPAEIEFTSLPGGATVSVDGRTLGLAPFKSYDVKPGVAHHLRFAKDGFEPWDECFSVAEGSRTVMHAELKPVKGLLLVTSEPAGAEISLDGYSLGETPRLVTTLDARAEHRLLIRKTGYRDSKILVKFNGRNPVAHHVNLVLNSGALAITSDPAGAEVTLNGIPRGTTPATVDGIPKGRMSITLKMDGYKTETRELSVNAGDSQSLFVQMEELPGALRLTSVPEGARFYIDGTAEGKSPVFAAKVKPGKHQVRAELEGFGTVERTVVVKRGETVAEEFRLENVLGGIEVRTSPPGAAVYIDGRLYGTTKSSDPNAKTSDVLLIQGIEAGEHTVIARLDKHAEERRKTVVENKKTTTLKIPMRRVLKPDVRIVTPTETIEGELVSSDASIVVVEYPLGIRKPISRDKIRTMELIEDKKEAR